jgi:hypothetical protein
MSTGIVLTDTRRLHEALGAEAESAERAMRAFVGRHHATIVDVGGGDGGLFTYPTDKASDAARDIQAAVESARPTFVTIVGDERVVPMRGVDVGSGEFFTDYFYGSHTGEARPDASVTRVIGVAAAMVEQLAETPRADREVDADPRALFLCSEDTRLHLETRAFLRTLTEVGYTPTCTMNDAAEALPRCDALIHFGHGSDTALSGRWQTYFTADEIPALPRGPIAFVDGCATTPPGSPLLRAFMDRGGTAYIGSSSNVAGMIPARYACELILHFLRRLSAGPERPLADLLRDARLDYLAAHPILSQFLGEASRTGTTDAGEHATDVEVVLQWQQYGRPFARLPRGDAKPVFCSRRLLAAPAVILPDEALRLSAPATPEGHVCVLALEVEWARDTTPEVRLAVRQEGALLHEVRGNEWTIYQHVADTCIGGHARGDAYRASVLLPLFKAARATEITIALTAPGPATVLEATVDTWPEDSLDQYINCLDWSDLPDTFPKDERAQVVSGPQMDRAEGPRPVRVTGVTGKRDEGRFVLMDLSDLYTRSHDSLQVGGADNASFATWFTTDRVEHAGVPFLVATSEKDVLVSPSNASNQWTLEGIDESARRIHLLVFGYNLPESPLSVRVAFADGSSAELPFDVYEWSGTQLPDNCTRADALRLMGNVAFDFESTVGFPHASIAHAVLDVPDGFRVIREIACDDGSFGLVAVSLER